MRNLTPEEQRKVIEIANATAKERHHLTTVAPRGNQSRFFQAQAEFHTMEVLLHHGTGRQIPADTVQFLKSHGDEKQCEHHQELCAFIRAVEYATGREIKL